MGNIYRGLVSWSCVEQRANRMLSLFFSSLLISSSLALVKPLPRELQPETKDLLCDTSDSTEDQIVEWIEQVCDLLSALVPEAICKSLIESQIPAIIDGLVNDNLNPQELCSSIGACSDPTPAPTDGPTPTDGPAPTDGPVSDPPTESPRLRKLL